MAAHAAAVEHEKICAGTSATRYRIPFTLYTFVFGTFPAPSWLRVDSPLSVELSSSRRLWLEIMLRTLHNILYRYI